MNDIISYLSYPPNFDTMLSILLIGTTILFYAYLIYYIFLKKRKKEYHSNWTTLIENLSYSTFDFYNQLEEEFINTGVEGISMKIVKLREGGIFSARREYLRVTWKAYQYDICGAPFGDGFFMSWWLFYKQSILQIILSRFPFIGGFLSRKLFPITYYKIDTASMFMTFAQSCVMKVVDNITKEKGLRALSEQERSPEIKNLFAR